MTDLRPYLLVKQRQLSD